LCSRRRLVGAGGSVAVLCRLPAPAWGGPGLSSDLYPSDQRGDESWWAGNSGGLRSLDEIDVMKSSKSLAQKETALQRGGPLLGGRPAHGVAPVNRRFEDRERLVVGRMNALFMSLMMQR